MLGVFQSVTRAWSRLLTATRGQRSSVRISLTLRYRAQWSFVAVFAGRRRLGPQSDTANEDARVKL